MSQEYIDYIMQLFETQGFEEFEIVWDLENPRKFCIELDHTDMYSRWITFCTNLFEPLIQKRTKYVSVEPIETAISGIKLLRIIISRDVDVFNTLSMEERIETIKHELKSLSSILDISNILDALSVVDFVGGVTVFDFNENGLVNLDASNCSAIEFSDDGSLLFEYSDWGLYKPQLFFHNAFLSHITVIAGLSENIRIDLLGHLINVSGGLNHNNNKRFNIINLSHFGRCIKVDTKVWDVVSSHKFLILKKNKELLNNGALIIIPLTNVRQIIITKGV